MKLGNWRNKNMVNQIEKEIVVICDTHIGAKTHQEQFLDFAIDYINEGEDRYWIYVGDGTENNLLNSAGTPFEQNLTPRQQKRVFIRKFTPIKDKCLAFNTHSNHPVRTERLADINPDEALADAMDMDYTLPVDELQVNVGDRTYDIIHMHGATGATTMGGKFNAIQKYAIHYDGDIFVMAHVHSMMQQPGWKIRHNKYREIFYNIGGSFLDFFNSYGQKKNYSPMPAQFGSLILTEHDKIDFKRFYCLDPVINRD
jgi:hypothetical protein